MARSTHSTSPKGYGLNDREQVILRSVVRTFIRTADPVGSKTIAQTYRLGLSPASIRSTLHGLEEGGYLGHPHTSAGRVPTQFGYRAYVDSLMRLRPLPGPTQQRLYDELARLDGDATELLKESARLLSQLSNLLGVVLSPRLANGVLHRLDVIPLASTRAMFVVSVRSGMVKTIVLDVETDLKQDQLTRVVALLNERLSGLPLEEIRTTFADRIRDVEAEDPSGLVKLIVRKASVLFSELPERGRLQMTGTQQMIEQPEFQASEAVRQMMAFVEDEHAVLQVLEPVGGVWDAAASVEVRIGAENAGQAAQVYSVVKAPYRMGDTVGTIGIVGPMRMDYARVVALVDTMQRVLNQTHQEKWN